jgi:proline iminopeptidase
MLKRVWRVIRWWELLLAPFIVAVLTFFAVAPRLTDSVAVLVLLTLLAVAMSAFAAAFHLFEASPSKLKKIVVAEVIIIGLVAGAGWGLFFRRPPPNTDGPGDRGFAFEKVELATGRKVALARLPGDGQRPPLLFLHGGPGRPVSAGDVAFLKAVSEKGIDVVLFDQGGTGDSDPIPRKELSVERAVAEVEALRQKLGLEKMSLLGQSWGARLAVEYAGRHRAHVERIIVTGGAPLSTDPTLWRFENRRTALKKDPSPLAFAPILAALALHSMNPELSEAFAPTADLNGIMASIVPSILQRSVCAADEGKVPTPKIGGLDGSQFLLLRGHLEKLAAPTVDPPAPSLVLRPECDFAQWRGAKEYRDWLKGKVVLIKGAGHAVWPFQADVARDLIVAFLKDDPLPLPVHQSDGDPAGDLPPLR